MRYQDFCSVLGHSQGNSDHPQTWLTGWGLRLIYYFFSTIFLIFAGFFQNFCLESFFLFISISFSFGPHLKLQYDNYFPAETISKIMIFSGYTPDCAGVIKTHGLGFFPRTIRCCTTFDCMSNQHRVGANCLVSRFCF